jgi:phytanoyl-CoA hydroxylase
VNLAFLKENGFFWCPGVLSPSDIALLGSRIDELIDKWRTEYTGDPRFWSFSRDGSQILYRIHRLETLVPFARDVLNSPAVLELRHQLLGHGSITTAFAAILKLPFSATPVPWHRDPVKTLPGAIFNLSLYLDDSNHRNGCLCVVPGSHVTEQKIPGGDVEPPGAIPVPASAGDIIIHDVLLIHGSGCNCGPTRRRSIVVEVQSPHPYPIQRIDVEI